MTIDGLHSEGAQFLFAACFAGHNVSYTNNSIRDLTKSDWIVWALGFGFMEFCVSMNGTSGFVAAPCYKMQNFLDNLFANFDYANSLNGTVLFKNNHIQDCGIDNWNSICSGFASAFNNADVICDGNTILNQLGEGIHFADTRTFTIKDNTISASVVGVDFFSVMFPQHVDILNNTISAYNPIVLSIMFSQNPINGQPMNTPMSATVKGNTLRAVASGADYVDVVNASIDLWDGVSAEVENNQVELSGAEAIGFNVRNCKDSTFENSTITGTGTIALNILNSSSGNMFNHIDMTALVDSKRYVFCGPHTSGNTGRNLIVSDATPCHKYMKVLGKDNIFLFNRTSKEALRCLIDEVRLLNMDKLMALLEDANAFLDAGGATDRENAVGQLASFGNECEDMIGESLTDDQANQLINESKAIIQSIEEYRVTFVRGDANDDTKTDISDAIATLGFLFMGNPDKLDCHKAADMDDSGVMDISDAVYLLNFLFLGGPVPEQPYPSCGLDEMEDELICESFIGCR